VAVELRIGGVRRVSVTSGGMITLDWWFAASQSSDFVALKAHLTRRSECFEQILR
jgi:hypothetical protein